jgi:hypothetical protein
MMPRRVRVEGDYFHGRIPAGAVYVGRSAPGLRGSKFQNRFRAGRTTPASWPAPFGGVYVRDAIHAVDLFRQLAAVSRGYVDEVRAELAGRDLACWCGEGPCHAEVLLRIAAGGEQ